MNATELAITTGKFDLAICGFMGWYDCFDFDRGRFTQPDRKAREIHRVLREGGRFITCSWEKQQDITWMEQKILEHYPEILEDEEYLERRPIGMSYEKPAGYQIIFKSAGFKHIEIITEQEAFVSTDEQEWWQMMLYVGWESLLRKVEPGDLQRVKQAIFRDLQHFKRADGIHFTKTVFFVSGVR